jgi:acetyl-CoA carboxylase carboxyltransferase component
VRTVIKTIADTDSFLELRPKFGSDMVTGLLRIEGRPFGVIANNPMYMAGVMEAEGAVKAGFKNELAAVEDPHEREVLYLKLVAQMYERGKDITMDAVINPADTRKWIMQKLKSAPRQPQDANHSFVDPWQKGKPAPWWPAVSHCSSDFPAPDAAAKGI